MMKNYDESVERNPNLNWRYILGHPYRILINLGFRSGKTNVLLNLNKTSATTSGRQLLIKGTEKLGLNQQKTEGIY